MTKAGERAVRRGDPAAVLELLQAGADVDARDRHGQTALMLAAHRGHREVVEALVKGGADLNVAAKYNLTVLMLAVVAGHAAVARTLARAGADLSARAAARRASPGRRRMIWRWRARWRTCTSTSCPAMLAREIRGGEREPIAR